MTLIKACIAGTSLKNSGKECDIAMGPTAMIIAVPPSTVIEEDDLLDIVAWIKPLLHAPKQSRVYPYFGSNAPINTITNDSEADVTVTLDDGTKVLVRRGVYNRIYETIAGGLCYADALFSLTSSGYRIIEVDQSGQVLLHANATEEDGTKTWSGIITSFMAGLAPTLATLTDIYRNRFTYSFTPQELVFNGEIFAGGEQLLSIMGLINVNIVPGVTPSTATHLYVKVQTECADSNLLTLLGAPGDNPLENPDLFIVNDKETGAIVPITGAVIIGDELQLAGAFVAGKSYYVSGAAAEEWYAADIEGYDAEGNFALVTVPV